MSVICADVNSALPDEIMETGMSVADEDSTEAITVSSPLAEEVPMETDLEEIVEVSSSGECISASVTEAAANPGNPGSHLAAVVRVPKPSPGPSATAMKTVLQSGIHKLRTPLPGQMILNKASELASGSRVIKQEKVYVTALGKGSNPIVFIPQHSMSGAQNQRADSKGAPQQIKLVTIGGQGGVSSVTSARLINTSAETSLQGQQIQNVQIGKKVPLSTSSGAVITKLIIAKPSNNKLFDSSQTTHSASVFTEEEQSALRTLEELSDEHVTSKGGIMSFYIAHLDWNYA